jgi:hypothetical protein
VGNCIGHGNHRAFVAYLSSQLLLLVWTFFLAAIVATRPSWDYERGCGLIAAIVTAVPIWYVARVLWGHILGILKNRTFYESENRRVVETYDQGSKLLNIMSWLRADRRGAPTPIT